MLWDEDQLMEIVSPILLSFGDKAAATFNHIVPGTSSIRPT
jgi:hypothetical protein